MADAPRSPTHRRLHALDSAKDHLGAINSNQLPSTISGRILDDSNIITVQDANFTLEDDGGTTRKARFQCSGIAASTTRTFTLPNASGTVALVQAGFASGSTNTPTTTSATYVDLDGDGTGTVLRVDLTTVGGDLYCAFSGTFSNSTVGAVMDFRLSLNGSANTPVAQVNAPVANYACNVSGHARFTGVSPGSNYVKVQWQTNSGTASANSVLRQLVVTEVMR